MSSGLYELYGRAGFTREWGRNPYDLSENNQVKFTAEFNPRPVGGFSPSGKQITDAGVATHESLQDHAVHSLAEVLSSQNVT
jgi:hypothetical protein